MLTKLRPEDIHAAGLQENVGYWAVENHIMLDGQPFGFNRHQYLIEPYSDNHPDQTYEKAAQMGATVMALLKSIHGCLYRYDKGGGYLFPTKTDVTDFSKGRMAPLLSENPQLPIKQSGDGKDPDAANIKRIGKAYLYFRGMLSRIGLKSVPLDFLVFDELDEAPDAEDLAMQRLAHSEFKHVLRLSTPTLPDFGIDKHFKETDQRFWRLKCPACGEFTCLEDEFPDCLREVKGGKVVRACRKCGGELNPSQGKWEAKRPSITDKRGHHFSQLFSHYVEPADILKSYRTTSNMSEFMNSVIGIPWVEAENKLTVQDVFACCGQDAIAESDEGGCSMGIDQGKALHVVVGKKLSNTHGKVIHCGEYPDWGDLDRLMRVFNVTKCVVDGQPETRNAREFAERHPGKVFLWFHNEHDQSSRAEWNDKTREVRISRTVHLDASHREITSQLIELPRRSERVKEFADHCSGIARKLIDKDREARTLRTKLTLLPTGQKVYRWIRLRPDHYRQAFSYESLARGDMLPVRVARRSASLGREREEWKP